jgi:hypothetical protein
MTDETQQPTCICRLGQEYATRPDAKRKGNCGWDNSFRGSTKHNATCEFGSVGFNRSTIQLLYNAQEK